MIEKEKQDFENMMEKVRSRYRDNEVNTKLSEIRLDVVWGRLVNRYFGKSASWFYNKFNGINGNGKPAEFTAEEKLQLKGALCDLADRIRKATDTL